MTGELWHEPRAGRYVMKAAPHVARRVRALFNVSKGFGMICIPDTPSNVEDLEWILARYPMKAADDVLERIAEVAENHRKSLRRADEIADSPNALPITFELSLPLRDYQRSSIALAQLRKRLLIGDDVGLGKTAQAIGVIAFAQARPAVVVCQTHLQRQWLEEIAKFAPLLSTHIIKTGKAHDYRLPDADVFVITYTKLAKWAQRLQTFTKTIVFDEAQELRKHDSQKYAAAKFVADSCEYAIGLSATPVYNYGDEVFSVIDAINPTTLGTRKEFLGEWTDGGMKPKVKDPKALGAYLREQHLFLRRTREEVGRELPGTNRIVQLVSYEEKVLEDLKKKEGLALARMVLEGSFTEKGQAARQLDLKLRQATGVAKAKSVAEFIAELGEKVVVAAWHRAVYDILEDELRERGVGSYLYTGKESPKQKIDSVNGFRDHDGAAAFLMSTRSGVGLNGLQEVTNICVFAELDWSDQVHRQIIGRVRRDGQKSQVTAFFLVADVGSDPIVSQILGLKTIQSEGVVNLRNADEIPSEVGAVNLESKLDNSSRMKILAEQYLKSA